MACQLPGLIKIITMPCERSGHRYCVSPPPPPPTPSLAGVRCLLSAGMEMLTGMETLSGLCNPDRYGNVHRVLFC